MLASHKVNGANGSPDPVLQRSLRFTPPNITASRGLYLTLENGQEVLDATSGAAVACLGHGNERVRDAVVRQMDKLSYCHSFMFATPSGDELGKLVIDSTGGRMSKAVFVSSGEQLFFHFEASIKPMKLFFSSIPS